VLIMAIAGPFITRVADPLVARRLSRQATAAGRRSRPEPAA
jgi:hypothetical protein